MLNFKSKLKDNDIISVTDGDDHTQFFLVTLDSLKTFIKPKPISRKKSKTKSKKKQEIKPKVEPKTEPEKK